MSSREERAALFGRAPALDSRKRRNDKPYDRRRDGDILSDQDDDGENVYSKRPQSTSFPSQHSQQHHNTHYEPPEPVGATPAPKWGSQARYAPPRGRGPGGGGKGGGRTGGGKGGGYRDRPREPSPDDPGMAALLLTRQLALQTAVTQRQQLKSLQYAILFPESAYDAKEKFHTARHRWHEMRPEGNQPHPHGSIHACLWQLFVDHIEGGITFFEQNRRDEIMSFTKASLNNPFHPTPWAGYIQLFSPRGRARSEPPKGTYVWILQINTSTTEGLALNTQLSRLVDTNAFANDEFQIKHDHGRASNLENQLRDLRL